MKRLQIYSVMVFALACSQIGLQAEDVSITRPVKHVEFAADLANTLAQISSLTGAPVIAELAQPLPKVYIAEGTDSGQALMDLIVKESPAYGWEAQGPVIHIFNTRLAAAPYNFLNRKFPRFFMPQNVSGLKRMLPTLELALLKGMPTEGGAFSGISDPEFERDTLQSGFLQDVTGREVLLHAASETSTFSTIVVFPTDNPASVGEAEQATANWFWRSVKHAPVPIYVQSAHVLDMP